MKLQKPAKKRKKRPFWAANRERSKISIKQEILALERGFEMVPSTGLPSGKIPDGIFLQAGLAVFAFAYPAKLIHRCAFQSLPRTKQLVRYRINFTSGRSRDIPI